MTIKRRIGFKFSGTLSNDEIAGLVRTYSKTGKAIRYRKVGDKVIPWTPRPGYVYSQVRAISARINQNYDAWPSEELKKSYKTFVGKPIFVNHTNEDWKTARGVVVAARYIEKGADKYVECVMETDAKRFPILGKELRTGGVDAVSMGVEAGFTICSVCDNKATDFHDMCNHIRFHKGEYFRNKKTGNKIMAYENCFKLGFFELSYVFDPADETAVVSRVIAASKQDDYQAIGWDRFQPIDKEAGAAWGHQPDSDKLHALMGDGHSLHLFPPHDIAPIHDPGNFDELAPGTGSKRYEWVHTHHGEPVNSGFATTPQEAKAQAEQSHKELSGGWSPEEDPFDPRQFGARRASKGERKREFMAYWYKTAFGETKAPEDIDTLRDESEDDTDLFHHWVESPPELQAPNMGQTEQLDNQQEQQGLDQDRNAEDAEEFAAPSTQPPPPGNAGQQQPQMQPDMPPADQSQPSADPYQGLLQEEADILQQEVQFLDDEPQDPVMPVNPPEQRVGRHNRGVRMGRFFYADDDDESYEDDDSGPDDDYGSDDDSGSDDSGSNDFGGSDDDSGDDDDSDDGGGEDIGALLDEAEDDIDAFEQGLPPGGGDDFGGGGGDDFSGEDEGSGHDEFGAEGGGEEEPDDSGGDEGGDSGPPWVDKESTRTVRRANSSRNKRGGAMTRQTLASRNAKARHFIADESGHTDGGPYGVDDSQGAQEDIFISQVPGSEAVAAPAPGDPQISNSRDNLVAYKRPQFDPNHYQRLADVVRALPLEQRGAMARKMVAMFTADNKEFNGRTFYEAAQVPVIKKGNRYFYAEELTAPDKVDPALSGTDAEGLKGTDFESLALENVETQPKDASIHAFRVFDQWLANVTGKTAGQHRNANFIRRAAASYVQNTGARLESLFPTLEYVLAEARKFEGGVKVAEDKSLEVAAPQDRIDVEAPVKNVTDADAQASQFNLSDFAGNASDNLADPVLAPVDGNAGTWAPDKGKESRNKLATASEAVRLADAYIAAYPNKYASKDRWTLTAQFETLRQPVVRDRIRVLEAVVEDQAQTKTARKVAAARSRGTKGIPVSFANSSRVAAAQKFSASDPGTDSAIFF